MIGMSLISMSFLSWTMLTNLPRSCSWSAIGQISKGTSWYGTRALVYLPVPVGSSSLKLFTRTDLTTIFAEATQTDLPSYVDFLSYCLVD
jgi:hypothetical protein